MLHTDGDITTLIPDFIAMGIDVLHPLEPCGGALDIYTVKARYGDRIALHGNIDLSGVLSTGTPQEVAQDVRDHLDRLAPGGGYIVSSSHNITEDIPVENFYAMRDAVVGYRYQGTAPISSPAERSEAGEGRVGATKSSG